MNYEVCCEDPEEGGAGCADHGPAITGSYVWIKEEKGNGKLSQKVGTMWVSNDEYSTQVNFCPFCGKQAPVQIGMKYKIPE